MQAVRKKYSHFQYKKNGYMGGYFMDSPNIMAAWQQKQGCKKMN